MGLPGVPHNPNSQLAMQFVKMDRCPNLNQREGSSIGESWLEEQNKIWIRESAGVYFVLTTTTGSEFSNLGHPCVCRQLHST